MTETDHMANLGEDLMIQMNLKEVGLDDID
jgi:hypothetical protein